MAKQPQNEEDTTPVNEGVSKEQLARAIVALANAKDAEPIKQIKLAKSKQRTPWNPDGNRKRPQLARVTWLNGFRLRESRLSNDEIRGFNALVPGKYHGRKWLVTARDDEEGAAIDVYFPNKTAAHRIDFRAVCPRGLIDALDIIKTEAAATA